MADPNSQNQLWSSWEFTIRESGRAVPRADVELNIARWLRQGFGSVGQARVIRTVFGWKIQLLVEGAPAHDAAYVASVRLQFQKNFVEKGWGAHTQSTVRARVVAGSLQDGRPAPQLITMAPHIPRGE